MKERARRDPFDVIAALRTGWYLNPGCGGPPAAFFQANQGVNPMADRFVPKQANAEPFVISPLVSGVPVMAVPSPDGLFLLVLGSVLLLAVRLWRGRAGS